MSNGKHSLSSLLGLAAVLGLGGGLGGRRGPREFGEEGPFSMSDGLPAIGSLEDMMLKLKSFEPMPEESRPMFDEIRRVFNALNFEDVEGLFITVLTRDPDSGPVNTEPCDGCGKVHSGVNVAQMASIMGDQVVMQAATNAAMRQVLKATASGNGRIDPMPDFSPRKKEEEEGSLN